MEIFQQIALWCAGFFVFAAIICGVLASVAVHRDVALTTRRARLRVWVNEALRAPALGLVACLFLWVFAGAFWVVPTIMCLVLVVFVSFQLIVLYGEVLWARYLNSLQKH